MFLDDRKKRILQAIVDDYVRFAEPIASKIIADKYDMDLSSATIRNEMMALEELGLIEKTHTSSGRIPSDLGYRYYVDMLMDYDNTGQDDLESLASYLAGCGKMLTNISKTLSGMTHYTTVSADENNLNLYGRNNVFDYPEFRDIERLKRFMYLMEEEDLIRRILRAYLDNDLTIKIGEENIFEDLKDLTVITFPYKDEGIIAVIGPKRMDYKTVVKYVRYLLDK